MASGSSTSHILQSLGVNSVIAVAKGVAAYLTGSGAMAAETLHSLADCANQLLLLLGVNRARRPPDEAHPFGYGRALYFYSFLVALMLFFGGGVYAVYEGIHKVLHREPVGDVTAGLVVLGVALVLEGWATWSNVKALNARRGSTAFAAYVRASKESDLIVVFGENSAAVAGLAFAFVALVLAAATGDSRWDGAGSLAVGLVLLAVAVFLAIEIKSLLVGERADEALERAARSFVAADARFVEILGMKSVQQGPGEALLAMKVRMKEGLAIHEVVQAINELEERLRAARPDAKWCFVEPDVRA